MKTVIEMARESNLMDSRDDWGSVPIEYEVAINAFAELVRADERNRTWTQEHWTEYEHGIAAAEREACAKVCETEWATLGQMEASSVFAAAIRARSNT